MCVGQVDAYLLDLAVDELPGVGWNICQKLKELGIKSVRDVRASTKDALQREIGNKTGATASLECSSFQHFVPEMAVAASVVLPSNEVIKHPCALQLASSNSMSVHV